MRSIRIQCTLNQIEWTGRPLVNLTEVLSYIPYGYKFLRVFNFRVFRGVVRNPRNFYFK